MKSRLTLIFAALVILVFVMIWVGVHRSTVIVAPTRTVEPSMATVPVVAASPAPVVAAVPVPAPAPIATIQVPAVSEVVPVAAAPTVGAIPLVVPLPPHEQPAPIVRVTASGNKKYVARDGDTVSQLAIALLGSDSKDHRDAVIAANPTLQANPDLVLAGQTYLSGPPSAQPVQASTTQRPDAIAAASSGKENVKSASSEKAAIRTDGPNLEYSAQPGDTVRGLAANLLGGDTKVNRDAIIGANASLQHDSDHLVAGAKYTISPPNGLAVDPNAPPAKIPTSQPDADDVLRAGLGRTLRYTAQSGDTVAKLAVALMGSDTPANRDLIIKSNRSLIQNPDQLIAGHTYWIAAPAAEPKP